MSTVATVRKIPETNASMPPQSQTPDYQDLRKQINDFESTFYGPHTCKKCPTVIIQMGIEFGGHAYDATTVEGKYRPHVCQSRASRHRSNRLAGSNISRAADPARGRS